MVCFQTKSLNLGKFWRAFEWQILVTIWNILWPFCIIYGRLVYAVVVICCIFPNWVSLDQEKSGNPGEGLYPV
jgi:hypothetical protein